MLFLSFSGFKLATFWSQGAFLSAHFVSFFPFFSTSKSAFTSSYLRLVILVSKDWTRFLASSFQRWVLFCCAVRRRVRSELELRLHSSSSRSRASSPCSFRLYSCSICDTWQVGGHKVILVVQNSFLCEHELCGKLVLCLSVFNFWQLS